MMKATQRMKRRKRLPGTNLRLTEDHSWNWTNPALQIRNFEISNWTSDLTVQFEIADFGFEMQDSSNFKITIQRFYHSTPIYRFT